MHYFGTKIITQPLEKEKKVTQPLGTKRNHTTSWDKKNHATSRGKTKIPQPLGTKKSYNLSGHKKIKQPQGTKKMTQPLETKQILHPLGHKNYATSRDKKITLSIGPITSQLVHKGPSCSK